MPERITDELLLVKAGRGDQTAFVELYERYRIPIFRFAYRLLGAADVAEDVTHDCFLNVVRNAGNFNPAQGSLRTYLYAAARNLAFKHFRRSGRESALDDLEDEPLTQVDQHPLRRLLDEELTERVREAVSRLPPLQREALVLFEYEDLPLSEIARVAGTDVGAVKSRLHRARQRVKSALAPYLNSDREIVTLEKSLK